MTQKLEKSNPKPKKISRSATTPAKRKAAPPMARTRATPKAVTETVTAETEVRMRAYALWERRGSPVGSPEVDWYQAQEQLSSGRAG